MYPWLALFTPHIDCSTAYTIIRGIRTLYTTTLTPKGDVTEWLTLTQTLTTY